MHLLFEEHHYHDQGLLRELLSGSDINPQRTEGGKALKLDYVGYFYNDRLKDIVCILPKVLMDEKGRVCDQFTPEELMQRQEAQEGHRQLLAFVHGFAVWMYRAISVYRDKHPDSDIAVSSQITQMGHGKKREQYTLLDVILELQQFNRDHQDYITFVLKNQHRGLNKINWTKTISKSQAIIQNNAPIYLNPVNKKREVNFDEELLIIYYSILNYIHEKYGFEVVMNVNYDLITGQRFEHYLNGFGKARLRAIKYKYFDDRALQLWDLCMAFFDAEYKVMIHADTKDYLLAHDFDRVFEDMVDELIGDEQVGNLKSQRDNKQLDHLYRYYGLTDHEDKEKNTYYIGDSKYYKRDAQIGEESIAKQFTYARNLVQYNLDLFLDNKASDTYQQYRDEQTEGYDIVPNFFISAKVRDISNEGYKDSGIEHQKVDGKTFHVSRHFENRLFDRDTILVAHYDVNFLYVIALYGRNNRSERDRWKDVVRDKFRKEIREGLEKEYEFYAMRSKVEGEDEGFLKENFKAVNGKVFKAYGESGPYSLALVKGDKENSGVKSLLEKCFYIAAVEKLGENPNDELDKLGQTKKKSYCWEENVLLGCVKSGEQQQWIEEKELYNVRLEGREGRPGSVMPTIEMMLVKRLVLYTLNEHEGFGTLVGEYVPKSKDMAPLVYSKAQMLAFDYPNPSSEQYLVYEIEKENNPKDAEFWKNTICKKLEEQADKGAPVLLKRGAEIN